ncbi:MAG: ChaN family lipoprotein [Spirulinaceae cyanobacterium RM2_2_10]|nr:ChaN family lipoprotein [Spirulinaceae cyanobacterium SM2_1_0]NJO20755.1 ChaN family lipoprotein [Spirulinaceae cyanobacterium RM2_2_10]
MRRSRAIARPRFTLKTARTHLTRRWQRWRRTGLAWVSLVILATTLACQTAQGEPLVVEAGDPPRQLAPASLIEQLRAANVVYLGEQHDRVADHEAQLEIVQALHAANPQLAIALEMFQHPFQAALDRYLAGESDEAALLAESEYEQRWGFPWEFYAPLLRFAKANQIPVIALNTPTEVTRQISGQGLASLDAAARQQIPPLDEIDTGNANYRRLLETAFSAHAAHGGLEFENFFAAQVTWDETMAMNIAAFHRAQPQRQVIVIAGRGHVIYGYGIPDRVARRLGPDLVQKTILLNPPAAINADGERSPSDFAWFSAPE